MAGATNRATTNQVHCHHPGCTAAHANHYWGSVKAAGWFHGRDGTAWCPEHLPAWVGPWRQRQARKRARTHKESP